MKKAEIVKKGEARAAHKIQNPENYTVIHAIKKAKARREDSTPTTTMFNPIRGLDKLRA